MKKNDLIVSVLEELGVTDDEKKVILSKYGTQKRENRKYNIYLTPTQVEEIQNQYPEIRLEVANKSSKM